MKIFKRITALALVLIMALSLSACLHKKDEIAVTIGDYEFTSAYYMCALIGADNEARSKVQESDELSEDEQNGTVEIDYYSKKIDEKKYVDWVEDRAIEILKEIAAYKALCKENNLTLSDDLKSEAEQGADYLWNTNGYSVYYEPNGVSEATYKKFTEDSYYLEVYFMSLYGEDGKKALKSEDVLNEIESNYILADILQSNYTDDLDDDQKEARKKLLEMNAEYIESGKRTFEDVYKEMNNITDDEETSEDEEESAHPYASILGGEDTSYYSQYYDTFKEYDIDKPVVSETTDESGALLVIKRDISKDEESLESLDSFARHALADEEFEKEIKAYVKKLDTKISKYAVNQFKVKEIIIPETTY